MSRLLPQGDFRAVRKVLDPDDFALGGDEPDPPPSDPISQKTWFGITTLADDVAIRTSDHNGKILGEVYWLWRKWIEAVGEDHDALFDPMLDAADDLQSSSFSALHGYYRAGFSALRNVLELMTIGTYGSLRNSRQYADWRAGFLELKFGHACDQLCREPQLSEFNERMRAAGHQSLWDTKREPVEGGYARCLYRKLCNYAHSRPGYTDGDLRRSNGPIFVGEVFWNWYCAYLQTISVCALSMFLARQSRDRQALKALFTDDKDVLSPDVRKAFRLV